MSKRMYYTYDIFDIADQKINMECFDFCYKKALECGLTCVCEDVESTPKLELIGTKWQFIKYYFLTLSECDCKLEGIRRLLSFILGL